MNAAFFTISQRLSLVAISFLLCFYESLLQSHHQSLLDVFQFFNKFLQTLFALPLMRVHHSSVGLWSYRWFLGLSLGSSH